MIWKIRAVEARPTDDENEYEFTAPILGSDGHEIQILDFAPGISFMENIEGEMVFVSEPATVVYAYPDRANSSELAGCGSSSENELTNRSE